MSSETPLGWQRLFEASEAVLAAVAEVCAARGSCPYPPELLGDPIPPAVFNTFTREELEEATAFLVRLGVLNTRRMQE